MEVNQLLCTWLGREPEDLAGQRFTDLLPMGQRLFYANHQALVETIAGGAQELSYDLRCADRSLLPVFVTTERLKGGGQVYCIYRAENRRRYEQQLQEAKKKAERATEARSEFVRTVTHELRTPVHAIASMAEILASEPLSDGQVAIVDQLSKSTQQLSDLINDLLDLSKAESGKLVLNAAPTSVEELCDALIHSLRPSAAEKGLTIEVAYEPLPTAWYTLDGGKLRQVLTNLLGNAIKFTDSGSVRLSVAATAPAQLTFAVEDTGLGIAPEDTERIFEAFEQSAGGQARGDSSGLGLSIGRHLVGLLGGKLEVESELGVGTEFHFTIPAEVCAAPNPEEGLHASASTSHTKQRLDGLRVLHVDDNETNRFIARRHLLSWGTDFTEASHGVGAIAAAEARSFDIILLDLRMPDLGGAEVAARIRAMSHHDGTPIYALSATESLELTTANEVFAGYLAKPYSGSALYALLAPHYAFRQNASPVGREVEPKEVGPMPSVEALRGVGGPEATIDFETIEIEFANDPEALVPLLTIMANNLEESRDGLRASVAAGAISVVDDYTHRYGTTLRLLAPQPLTDLLTEAGTPEPMRDNAILAERLLIALDETVKAIRERVG